MIFDTHAHYDDEKFDPDRVELLSSMGKDGITNVGTIINVGASFNGCIRSVELAHQYPYIYAAVGIHPENVSDYTDASKQWMNDQCTDNRVVAIGEIGLDYYWEKDESMQSIQRDVFWSQMELAKKADLPVIVHSRDAAEDTLAIMKRAKAEGIFQEGRTAVLHCFSYSLELAQEYLKLGYYIGIGGVVTFKNGKKLKQVAASIPLDRILIETDCPYMAPEPFRGYRNDSTYLPYVVKEIAKLREITEDEVIAVTEENARRFFRI